MLIGMALDGHLHIMHTKRASWQAGSVTEGCTRRDNVRWEEHPLLGAAHHRIPRGRRIGVLLRQQLPTQTMPSGAPTLATQNLHYMHGKSMCPTKP